MGELSVWHKGQSRQIGGVSHRTTAAAIVGFALSEGLWVATEQARRSGRCYALFENWRGCQRLIPPWKRIYKLWKLWGLERIHVKFLIKKVAMETLIRKNFEEYVEVSQLKVPKRHVALRMEPHVLHEDTSGSDHSSNGYDDTGLFIVDDDGGEGVENSPGVRRKRSLLHRVVRQNEQLRDISRTVDDVDEEILFYEAKLHHCRVVEGGKDYVQDAYLSGDEERVSGSRAWGEQSPDSLASGGTRNDKAIPEQCSRSNSSQSKVPDDLQVDGQKEEENNATSKHLGMDTCLMPSITKKISAKVVVVNPLPRPEVAGDIDEHDTANVKCDGECNPCKDGDSVQKTVPVTPEIPPLANDQRLSTKNASRNWLRAQKRHDKYGGRIKKRTPGLYEFEHSCEWLKVMDRELKRLESIENLSFVDWDSESLLSDKDLSFFGGRKYKFRPAFSGRNVKSRAMSDDRAKNDERANRELAAPSHDVSAEMSKSPHDARTDGHNRECATVHPLPRTDAHILPVRPEDLPVGTTDRRKIVDESTSSKPTSVIECNNNSVVKKLPLFPLNPFRVRKLGKNCRTQGQSTDETASSSRCTGTSTGDTPQNDDPMRMKRDDRTLLTSNLSNRPNVRESSVDAISLASNEDVHISLDTCATEDALWQLPNFQVMDKVNSTSDKENEDESDSPATNVRPDAIPSHSCKVAQKTRKVTFLSDQLPQLTIARSEKGAQFDAATCNQVRPCSAIPRDRAVESPPAPAVRRSVTKSTPSRRSPQIPPKDGTTIRRSPNVSYTPSESNSTRTVCPDTPSHREPVLSPMCVRRVPKPPIYYPSEDSVPLHHSRTSHSVSSDLSHTMPSVVKCIAHKNVPTRSQCRQYIAPVHPRVGQLRNTQPRDGFVLTPADYTRVSTRTEPFLHDIVIHSPSQSNIVGTVTCPSDEVNLKDGPNVVELSACPIKATTTLHEPLITTTPPPRVQSPDQGLGPEIVSLRDDPKSSENDSSSDAGMGSIHSQDSGISNASVVIETWV